MTTVHLYVRPVARRIGRLVLRDWLAITIGHTVVSWRRLDAAELAHELRHVAQWERHGPVVFPIRYLLASAQAAARGGSWYRDNAFEMEARAAADQARARWTE